MNNFQAIAAMAENRVIGKGNKLAWHYPEDLARFRKMTLSHNIVMGRKTFESIGKPLLKRRNFVISRNGFSHPGVKVCQSLDELPFNGKTYFICGGGEIYRTYLHLCSDLFLTMIKSEFQGDTYFPPFENDFDLVETLMEKEEFDILWYKRR